MTPAIVYVYLILCLMVALLGRRSRLGFFRSLLFSIMLTPLLMTLFLLMFVSYDTDHHKK